MARELNTLQIMKSLVELSHSRVRFLTQLERKEGKYNKDLRLEYQAVSLLTRLYRLANHEFKGEAVPEDLVNDREVQAVEKTVKGLLEGVGINVNQGNVGQSQK